MPLRETDVTQPGGVRADDPMVRFELQLPRSWKRWLEDAANARAMSVGDLVRQCIRSFMVQRREDGTSS